MRAYRKRCMAARQKARVECEALARGGRGRGRFCNNLMAIYRCREKLEGLSLSLLVRRQAVWDQGTCRDGKGRKSLHHTSAHLTRPGLTPRFLRPLSTRPQRHGGEDTNDSTIYDKIHDPSHVKEMLRAWKRVLASCSTLRSRGISHKIENNQLLEQRAGQGAGSLLGPLLRSCHKLRLVSFEFL